MYVHVYIYIHIYIYIWGFEERERLMEFNERVSGARMHAAMYIFFLFLFQDGRLYWSFVSSMYDGSFLT